MRSMIRLPSSFRCQFCHNLFRSKSTVTDNSPFLNVVTDSTIVGRPFLKDEKIYVQHPVYSALNVLLASNHYDFDPFNLVEVEVAPLGNWLMKASGTQTVREYLKEKDIKLNGLDPDKVYISNLEDHIDFFGSVTAVGTLRRKVSSLRSDNVWYLGGFEAKPRDFTSLSFSPDTMLEPEKKLEGLPVKDMPIHSGIKCFYNESQKTFAMRKNLPPDRVREDMKSSMLKRYNVITKPHEKMNMKDMRNPNDKKELMKRRDFQSECVFSIDPPTARDLDDALHVKQLSGGLFEVGVHIADVSYFVPSKSRLCYDAMLRGTTFYLGDEVIPMLPSTLSDDLCSLHPGGHKLTMSVVFEIDQEGDVKSYWIGESFISSAAKMSYTQANEIIETKTFPNDLQLHGNHSEQRVIDSILLLQQLSVKLRNKRQARGALTLSVATTEPYWIEGDDAPLAFAIKLYGKSSVLIEEFMLLANMTVAEFLHNKLPNQAVLRRHPQADEVDLLALLDDENASKPKKMSATEILKLHQELLDKHTRLKSKSAVSDLNQVLSYFAIRSMYPAEYVLAKTSKNRSDYFHFGLQAPLYTHFTSPIRRFADLVVHYQVKALLQMSAPPDRVFVLRSVAISNFKRTMARRLSRDMLQFHVWNALMATGSVFSKVVVVSFSDRRIRFYSPTFELLGDLQLADDQSILKKSMMTSNHMKLTVRGCSECKKELQLDVKPLSELYCYLSPGKKMDIRAALAHTICCPNCGHRHDQHDRRRTAPRCVETINHKAALNAPPRPQKNGSIKPGPGTERG